MAVMYASYSLKAGETIKESVVRESGNGIRSRDKCVEDGKSMAMLNESL